MQALLDYLQTASIPRSERPNVCDAPVQSTTLGIVNHRSNGYGLSAATAVDKFKLLTLLLQLAADPLIAGCAPHSFTSICLNVNFGCDLHSDKHNERDSWIVRIGDYEGGELFLEGYTGNGTHCSIEHCGSHVDGESVSIKSQWQRFNGSRRHSTLPYKGYRVSCVFFNSPIDSCTWRDLAILTSLGFHIPCTLHAGHAWPYQVFICSTRRNHTIGKDTLSTLLADGSVRQSCVTLCVADEEDAEHYQFGLRRMVAPGGLPAQRRACTMYLPSGSWCLFMDDDVTRIRKPTHLSVHALIVLGFMSARKRRTHIFGLNTSTNSRSLRDNVSSQLGLINGYFYGIIVNPDLCHATPTSDTVGGASEDVERSLIYYAHSGLTRLNFATAVAKTKTNQGGLQHHYTTPEQRQVAHEHVLRSLSLQFPSLMMADGAPNGCTFARQSIGGPESDAEEEGQHITEDESPHKSVMALPTHKATSPKSVCDVCGKSYARKEDLRHHVHSVHSDTPISLVRCPTCAKPFKRKKDMTVHVSLNRCHSLRGRPHGTTCAIGGPNSNDAQFPTSDQSSERYDDSALG